MIFPAMHRFVEFWNRGDEFSRFRNSEAGGPVLFHPHKKVDEPLAGDIVAQDNDKEGEELDNKGRNDRRHNEVHVCVSANGLANPPI